jgi:hypothetical protein
LFWKASDPTRAAGSRSERDYLQLFEPKAGINRADNGTSVPNAEDNWYVRGFMRQMGLVWEAVPGQEPGERVEKPAHRKRLVLLLLMAPSPIVLFDIG